MVTVKYLETNWQLRDFHRASMTRDHKKLIHSR